MTTEYVVTDTELTATANAIRTKRNIESDIEWVESYGFKSAIEAITGGGFGGGESINVYAVWFTPTKNANSALSGGLKMTPKSTLKAAGVRIFARGTTANVYISDVSGNTLASKENATVTDGQWNDVFFDNPITLTENVAYMVWGSNASNPMKYRDSAIGSAQFVTVNGNYFSTSRNTFPTTEENNNAYGVDLIISIGSAGGTVDDWTTLDTYIESSGTQYIDTGYIVKDTSIFELVANVSSNNSNYATPFGTREADGSSPAQKACLLFAKYSGASTLYYNWGTYDTSIASDQNILSKKAMFTLSKSSVSMQSQDNYIFGNPITGGTVTSIYNLYLFSLNQGGSDLGSLVHCTMKLYRFRIYENDTLAHEFVPWKDSNNVVCLKDTVTGDLKYNAGSGTFTYGQDS